MLRGNFAEKQKRKKPRQFKWLGSLKEYHAEVSQSQPAKKEEEKQPEPETPQQPITNESMN